MENVFKDPAWTETNFQTFEDELKKNINQLGQEKNIKACLVDIPAEQDLQQSVLVTDCVIFNHTHIRLYPEYWGIYHINKNYQNTSPRHLFNCFIARPCPFRQSWLYQFVRRNLLDQGNISYNLSKSHHYPNIYGKELFNRCHFDIDQSLFDLEYKIMLDRVPFNNFNSTLAQAVVDSKIGIVIETYFTQNYGVSFSEKTFRHLQLPRPFMLFGNTRAVSILRDIGFDLYDDIVDHSYDSIEDPVARQMFIIKFIENFSKFKYTNSVLSNFESRANHNRKILFELKNDWPRKLHEVTQTIQNF